MQACAVITFIRVFLPLINVQIGAFLYGQGRIDTSGKDCSGLRADLSSGKGRKVSIVRCMNDLFVENK